MKCVLGNSNAMDNKLNCSKYIADDVATACMDSSISIIKILLTHKKISVEAYIQLFCKQSFRSM